jgi:mevalonate kinase
LKRSIESASAKIILFGEHAVVYGQPAIALPVSDLRAYCEIIENQQLETPVIIADDFGIQYSILDGTAPAEIQSIINALAEIQDDLEFKLPAHGWQLRLWSHIPIARGLGSSAAISVALIRAVFGFIGLNLDTNRLLKYSYQLEKFHHGTPSGIDNTVIAMEKPVKFVRQKEPETFTSPRFHFVIGDTGVVKSTGSVVEEVSIRYNENFQRFTMLFSCIGKIALDGMGALKNGDVELLGTLMNQNQLMLDEIGVSCEALDNLIMAARRAGASGAKLCGAGKGGCMLALAPNAEIAEKIKRELLNCGATQCYISNSGGAS